MNCGKTFVRFFFSSDLVKLVTKTPEQGFKHFVWSTSTWFTQSRSFEEQSGTLIRLLAALCYWLNVKHLFWISDVERYASALLHDSINIMSCSAVVKWFNFTFSYILIQWKKGVCYFNFCYGIKIVFMLPLPIKDKWL